jgi:hypothetical protein
MHMNEVTYSTNNNIYITAGYAKTVNAKQRFLICKPSLVTSLYLTYVLHRCPHTNLIPWCLSKKFQVTLDIIYICCNI